LFVDAGFVPLSAGHPVAESAGALRMVHTHVSRWVKSGVWEKLFKHLAVDANNEYALIDSTIVCAHQHHGAGTQKRGGTKTKLSGAAGAD